MDVLLKNQVFATHAIAAAGSVALGTALTYPLDTIKVLIQVSLFIPSFSQIFKFLQRTTWVLALMLMCYGGAWQVGSASNKQLTAAQVLDRVKKLSGNSGNSIIPLMQWIKQTMWRDSLFCLCLMDRHLGVMGNTRQLGLWFMIYHFQELFLETFAFFILRKTIKIDWRLRLGLVWIT